MTTLALFLAAAAAQYYPQYPQQPYPPQYQQPYPGYPQNQNVIGQIVDSLLGNRYNYSERQAVRSCAVAAVERAQAQYAYMYGRQPYGGYNGQYPQAWQGYPGVYPGYMRVTAINSVERRSATLRVRGFLDSGLRRSRNNYGVGGDLSFRCDVNYNGYVTNVKVERRY
jgi:hypothetical protein